jgi:hypothetical protein|tara:strand:+ start:269 stop:766 length:498 start_codon:yes stop_codon:yes gene_type:complete
MWTVIKIDNKYSSTFKKELKNKLGNEVTFYSPKFLINKFIKNKLVNKEINLLNGYLFCFHSKFRSSNEIKKLRFTKGLKYFLNGYSQCQTELEFFIDKCKKNEDSKGYLKNNFLDLKINEMYKFATGPFSNSIFKLIEFNKNKIKILLGSFETTLKKDKNLFYPV